MCYRKPTVRRTDILRLYRMLLKAGSQLKYTNKDFYIFMVKKEFREQQHLKSPSAIQFQFNKGIYFLNNDIGGL
eukprot:Pgem_evm1s10039